MVARGETHGFVQTEPGARAPLRLRRHDVYSERVAVAQRFVRGRLAAVERCGESLPRCETVQRLQLHRPPQTAFDRNAESAVGHCNGLSRFSVKGYGLRRVEAKPGQINLHPGHQVLPLRVIDPQHGMPRPDVRRHDDAFRVGTQPLILLPIADELGLVPPHLHFARHYRPKLDVLRQAIVSQQPADDLPHQKGMIWIVGEAIGLGHDRSNRAELTTVDDGPEPAGVGRVLVIVIA